MIDDKKIEAAARRYSEVTDCDKQEALLIEEGFKEGAKWAINKFFKDLLHPSEEIPEEERLKMLPIRNLKIEIGDISGELHDCRIIDYKNTGRISILVNEIK